MNLKRKLIRIVFHVALPILIGGLIYLLLRCDEIVLVQYFKRTSFQSSLINFRKELMSFEWPAWFVYNLPDGLWVYGYTSIMLMIWNGTLEKANSIWVFLPVILAVISEFGQLFGVVPGTFDYFDIVFMLLAQIISLYKHSNLKTTNHENLQTS